MSDGLQTFRFTVPANPMGKPRMTQRDKWKKRPCVVRYRNYADLVRLAFRQRGTLPPNAVVLSLSWVAWLEMPKSWSKKKKAEHSGQLHMQKPDRDNIDKAILDALFDDDSGIAAGTIEKRWCPAGEPARLEVTIEYQTARSAA